MGALEWTSTHRINEMLERALYQAKHTEEYINMLEDELASRLGGTAVQEALFEVED